MTGRNRVERAAAILTVHGRGDTEVSVSESQYARAESGMRLYPGDSIQTGGAATAGMRFFDGTVIALDQRSRITLDESSHGSQDSRITTTLHAGSAWVATPSIQTFSGSIVREIMTQNLNYLLPSKTEALVSARTLAVFSGDGLGIQVDAGDLYESIHIGEGQQWNLPETILESNLYTYRTPIDPNLTSGTFLTESRNLHAVKPLVEDPDSQAVVPTVPTLEVTSPTNGITVAERSVIVSGSVGEEVQRVRVNGYQAQIDTQNRSFTQELSLPEEEEIKIVIEAIDHEDAVIGQETRTINRNLEPPPPPTITFPAGDKETYRTQQTRFEIRGKAPEGTIGIIVNDYRLQLYQPGDTTWTYLASTLLGNMKPGVNVYRIAAINGAGFKSEEAILTIVFGEGPEGLIDTGEAEGEPTEPSETTNSDSSLSQNPPLLPGTLIVSRPTPGLLHTETATGVLLIEGSTSVDTHSMWVNDYQLQLYRPGSDFWNYIASIHMLNLRRGENSYNIVARDAQGRVLDRLIYQINFRPGRGR